MENLSKDEMEQKKSRGEVPSTDNKRGVDNENSPVFLDKSVDIGARSTAFYEYINNNKEKALPKVLKIARDIGEDQYFRATAIRELERIKDGKTIGVLIELAKQEEVKIPALATLATLGAKEVWEDIVESIFESHNSWEKRELCDGFRRGAPSEYELRTKTLLDFLRRSNYTGSSVDASVILEAIRPDEGWPRNQDVLINYLINYSLDQDSRMTQIIAKLLIESCNGSQTMAGRKIEDFEGSHNIDSDKLKGLRINIGGEIALDPILNVLKINLEENFQQPISDLNKNTENMWQKTIKYAQYGFIVRIGMSIVVFVLGVLLLIVSTWEILYGDIQSEKLYGTGVSFVTGLGMMITIVYSGPLKEIRKSVNDLGVSSAAFIAYIHRVLEISHTFSFYYLKQSISFDEMKTSSDLINSAMKNTVEILSMKDPKKTIKIPEIKIKTPTS